MGLFEKKQIPRPRSLNTSIADAAPGNSVSPWYTVRSRSMMSTTDDRWRSCRTRWHPPQSEVDARTRNAPRRCRSRSVTLSHRAPRDVDNREAEPGSPLAGRNAVFEHVVLLLLGNPRRCLRRRSRRRTPVIRSRFRRRRRRVRWRSGTGSPAGPRTPTVGGEFRARRDRHGCLFGLDPGPRGRRQRR